MSKDLAEGLPISNLSAHVAPSPAFPAASSSDLSGTHSRDIDQASPLNSGFSRPLAAPWMAPLKSALNYGGTNRRWHSRTEAKRKHVQIATVDPLTGRPSVRTVVFRGFLPQKFVDSSARSEESFCLCFITDDRSAKFAHLGCGLTQGAPMECCWWLDEAGVQFRVAGRTLVATARSEDDVLRAAAAEVWQRLGDSTKLQMFWPQPGALRGEACASGATTGTSSARDPAADGSISLEDSHFALLILVPDAVDELHLSGRQKRVMCVAPFTRCICVTSCADTAAPALMWMAARCGAAHRRCRACVRLYGRRER
jgi:pyridoxamine 5'-phosphate oxidase